MVLKERERMGIQSTDITKVSTTHYLFTNMYVKMHINTPGDKFYFKSHSV